MENKITEPENEYDVVRRGYWYQETKDIDATLTITDDYEVSQFVCSGFSPDRNGTNLLHSPNFAIGTKEIWLNSIRSFPKLKKSNFFLILWIYSFVNEEAIKARKLGEDGFKMTVQDFTSLHNHLERMSSHQDFIRESSFVQFTREFLIHGSAFRYSVGGDVLDLDKIDMYTYSVYACLINSLGLNTKDSFVFSFQKVDDTFAEWNIDWKDFSHWIQLGIPRSEIIFDEPFKNVAYSACVAFYPNPREAFQMLGMTRLQAKNLIKQAWFKEVENELEEDMMLLLQKNLYNSVKSGDMTSTKYAITQRVKRKQQEIALLAAESKGKREVIEEAEEVEVLPNRKEEDFKPVPRLDISSDFNNIHVEV